MRVPSAEGAGCVVDGVVAVAVAVAVVAVAVVVVAVVVSTWRVSPWDKRSKSSRISPSSSLMERMVWLSSLVDILVIKSSQVESVSVRSFLPWP